jgi:hypothetical protein
MSRNQRSWAFGILFWVMLLISVGLSGRYPWLDATWFIGILLLIAVLAIVPRFGRWALWDDEQFKLWDVKRKSNPRSAR